VAEYRNCEIVCASCKHSLVSHSPFCGVIGCGCVGFAWRNNDALAAAVVADRLAAQKAALNAPPPRTFRLLVAVGNGNGEESLYAVASDDTLWHGYWMGGTLTWTQNASLPQGPSAFPAEAK